MNWAALSSVYPGYQEAESTQAQTAMRQLQARQQRDAMEGQALFGRMFQQLSQAEMPGAMPLPPQPGQQSMPAQPQGGMPMGMPPRPSMGPGQMPPGPGPMAPPPGQLPPGPGGGLRQPMDWRTLAALAWQADPNAKPEVIAAAVAQWMPLMNQQSQQEFRQLQLMLAGQRADIASERASIAGSEAERRTREGEAKIQRGEEGLALRGRGLDIRARELARRGARDEVLRDQGVQRLDQQRQALEQRIVASGDRNALGQWRAIVDAQHKKAQEVVSTYAASLPKDVQKDLLQEQKTFYENQLEEMRKRVGSSTPSGGTGTGPKTEGRVPPASGVTNAPGSDPAAPPSQALQAALPPDIVSKLKEGFETPMTDGSWWTIKNGKPERVR